MKSNILGITHVTLKCNDFEKMRAFYRDVLLMEELFTIPYSAEMAARHTEDGVKEGDPWLTYFKVADRQFIELFNEKYDAKYKIPEYSFMHLSVLVKDIVEAARHLEACGLTLWAGPKYANNPYKDPYPPNRKGKCGSYAFYVQDPEGNEVEFMEYSDTSLQLNSLESNPCAR